MGTSLGAGPTSNVEGFQQGLRQLGYVEGRNLVLFYRWAAGKRKADAGGPPQADAALRPGQRDMGRPVQVRREA